MSSTQTMDTFATIEARRSVKHYDANHKISDDEVKKLFEATILSPTSFNIQNWRFVNITDKALRERVWEASWKQAQVKDASLLILICADLNATDDRPERYWANSPEEVSSKLVPMITGFYKDNEQLRRDEALRSVGIASQTLMLAAKAMGYDSCPMIGFDPNKVAEIIKLPDSHIIGLMLTIGKASQPARERGGQLPLEEVMVTDTF